MSDLVLDTAGLLKRNSTLLLQQPCCRPIQQRFEKIDTLTGEVTTDLVEIPCQSQWQTICPSCSARRARDNYLLFSAGLVPVLGGQAPERPAQVLFLTLTAPSFGTVHRANQCPCGKTHKEDASLVGTPVNYRTYRYKDQVIWNAKAGQLFMRTIDRLKKEHPGTIEYAGSVEFQKRQTVHFHILLKTDLPFNLGQLREWILSTTTYAGASRTGDRLGWGPQLDIQEFSAHDRSHMEVNASTSLDDLADPEMLRTINYALKTSAYLQKDLAYTQTDKKTSRAMLRFIDRLETIAEKVRESGELYGLKPRVRLPLGGGAGFTGQRIKRSRGWALIVPASGESYRLTHKRLAEDRAAFKGGSGLGRFLMEKLGAPFQTSLDEYLTRRQFPDQLVASLRVLAAALRGSSGPPAVSLDHA